MENRSLVCLSENSDSNELNNDGDQNDYSNTPIVSFGILSDVQYADTDDDFNYAKDRLRYYRNSRNLVREAVNYWSLLPNDVNFQFILQLGDLIDGKCKKESKQNEALNQILSEFKDFKVYHCWGNHEFYNFNRAEIVHTPLNTAKLFDNQSNGANYYAMDLTDRLRLICLDSYDFSMLGYADNHETYIQAHKYLTQHNKNEDLNSADNLRGHAKRFSKINGSVSDTQLKWLKNQLIKCKESNLKAIVCGHIPIHPQACDTTMCLAWNYKDVLDLLWLYGNLVVAYLCGHDHAGGYFRDKCNIHHLTLNAIVETPANTNSFATVKVCNDKILIEGVGLIQYYEIYF
jgi:manganese-dependent ADP-ribose/CDP-alcohol diphosphatase